MTTAPTGVWAGQIVAIDGGRCAIRIPQLTGDRVHQTVRFVLPLGAPDAAVGATSAPVGDEDLALRPLHVGDEVLVGFLNGSRDRPVVLGRLT